MARTQSLHRGATQPDATGSALPSGAPLPRRALCGLAQPCLARPQQTRGFRFFEATLLLVVSGELTLDAGDGPLTTNSPLSLMVVDQHARADLTKLPGGQENRFRSIFLSLSPALVSAFYHAYPALASIPPLAKPALVPLDDDLSNTLRHCVESIEDPRLSDERLHHRLMDLLLALSERHCLLARPSQQGAAERLRVLFSEDPARPWTARDAGRELAMSESTLRRRLADERVGFEALLIDVRMHHAMMLMQTTRWPIPRIADACGYRSRARFTERFRERFGALPSDVR